jgi:hypothetical protein
VRTRTLLLLAVACGLAILVAGVVQLLRIGGGEAGDELLGVGDEARVGDVVVEVTSFEETAERAIVAVRLGGADDPDGARGFALVVPGERLAADAAAPGACVAVTVTARSCTLTFPLDDAGGGTRILLYSRGEEGAGWALGEQ